MMHRNFSRESSRDRKGAITLQKKIIESRRFTKGEPHVPDLTDFMNDMFFGTVNNEKKAYNLTGGPLDDDEEAASFDDSVRSNSSKLTQEWLEEARRMVASSPSRCDSPSRLAAPRFTAVPEIHSSASVLDRRDPLSRSARRQRPVGVSGEILTKSVKHNRNNSASMDNLPNSPSEPSPASQIQQWFSNFLKPSNPSSRLDSTNTNQPNLTPSAPFDPTGLSLPPRQSIHRKSRFQTEPPPSVPQEIPIPPRRCFKPAPLPDNTQLLSPPKNLIESAHRRSISSSSCSQPESQVLSPPRILTESARTRSISKSTCSFEKPAPSTPNNNANGWHNGQQEFSINGFLKEQKIKTEQILNKKCNSKAKLILSGPSNSTSSMAAAICYAWLLQTRLTKNKVEGNGEEFIVVPVMNLRRGKMWKQRQAAWLFHHVGIDSTSLLFADEVDFENLMMTGKLNILVIGQDILKNDGEVRSQCTILTDNYCEDAYHMLQTPMLKKLLLAGILLDTQNLNASAKMSMTRDAEAVQLLLVGSDPNYCNALFYQLMQDQRDNTFFEALRHNYGKPPSEVNISSRDNGAQVEQKERERKSSSASEKSSNDARNAKTSGDAPKSAELNAMPAPAAAPEASRGKNKFFLAKWFGFG